MLDRNQTVASIVLDHSECAEVFQHHRIDFCCRGDASVEQAAKERGIDVDVLLHELSRAIAEREGGARHADPRELPTRELVAHIVSKHHEYLRRTLPFVSRLAAKVGRVHGDHNPKLRGLDEAVAELAEALLPHLDDEEQALFPLLVEGAKQDEALKLLQEMHSEHLEVAKLLERIHAASDGFTVPDWACNSYRTLFAELRALESDVFAHVHLENHVLSPRFAHA